MSFSLVKKCVNGRFGRVKEKKKIKVCVVGRWWFLVCYFKLRGFGYYYFIVVFSYYDCILDWIREE